MKPVLLALPCLLLLGAPFAHAQVTFPTPPNPWVPPTGIPAPPFGVMEPVPARPASWPGAVSASAYYVDCTAGNNTNNENGTPNNPRASVPTTLPAGSYVEVRGSCAVGGNTVWTLNGSRANPIFIVGVGAQVTGSESIINLRGAGFIIQGLRFVNTKLIFNQSNTTGGGVQYGVIRRCELTGSTATSGAMIGFNPVPVGSGPSNILIYNNYIHDNGPQEGLTQTDLHGLKVGSDVHANGIWYVDNHSHNNAGDSVQLGSASAPDDSWPRDLFIGRNLLHGDNENSFDVKKVRDVVFSDNVAYDNSRPPSRSSSGECIVVHDGAERVWIVNNVVHTCGRGITSTGSVGFSVVGNVVYNIHDPEASSSSLSGGNAISIRATTDARVINNTVYDADHGIGLNGSAFDVINNIVATVSHVQLGFSDASANTGSVVRNNLFGGSLRIAVNSTIYTTLSSYENGTTRASNMVASPLFRAPPGDFRLQPGSPAIDNGYSNSGQPHAVFALFESTYGASYGNLRHDLSGTPRPSLGDQWERGAYEGPTSAIPPPGSPTNLRIIR